MSKVEPDGHNPNEVKCYKDGVGEGELNPAETIRWRELTFSADDFCPHHVAPEILQVKQKTQAHDDAKHQHVLTCPFHSRWLVGHLILVVAASLTVLKCEDEGVDDVNRH